MIQVVKTTTTNEHAHGSVFANGKFYLTTRTNPSYLIEVDYDLNVRLTPLGDQDGEDLEYVSNKLIVVCKKNIVIVDPDSLSVLNKIQPLGLSLYSDSAPMSIEKFDENSMFVSYSYYNRPRTYVSRFYNYELNEKYNTLTLNKVTEVSGWGAMHVSKSYNGLIYGAGYLFMPDKTVAMKVDKELNVTEKEIGNGIITDDGSILNDKLYLFSESLDRMVVLSLDTLDVLKVVDLPYQRQPEDPAEGEPIPGYANDVYDGLLFVTTPGDEIIVIDPESDEILTSTKINGMRYADELKFGDDGYFIVTNWYDGKVFLCRYSGEIEELATLKIQTTPSGAKVYVDGVYKGDT